MKPLSLVLGVALAACMPQQLVLRRASVDWEARGIRAVAVVPMPPPPRIVTSDPASTAPASTTGHSPASTPNPAPTPSAPLDVGYGEGDLVIATRDAAELLTFALRQSAVEIVDGGQDLPRIELTVKEIRAEEETRDSRDRDTAAALRQSTVLSLRDDGGYRRASRVVKATVLARLLEPGSARPVWFKEAIGSVDLGMTRSAVASMGDPFPPPRADRSSDEEVLRFYREIAVRRALKQIADDLLPHYEYVEVK